jgi:hypothetical protein
MSAILRLFYFHCYFSSSPSAVPIHSKISFFGGRFPLVVADKCHLVGESIFYSHFHYTKETNQEPQFFADELMFVLVEFEYLGVGG